MSFLVIGPRDIFSTTNEPEPVDSAAGFPVEGTAPAVSPLEAAWAEVEYAESIHEIATHERQAAQMREESARLALAESKRKARAIGPRPAKAVPS